MHNNSSGLDGSTRSEGDLDSYVDSCGFMDWPSAAWEGEEETCGNAIKNGEDTSNTIQEESADQVKREEEWNIEVYEGGDDSDQGRLRNSFTNKTQWDRLLPKRSKSFLEGPGVSLMPLPLPLRSGGGYYGLIEH